MIARSQPGSEGTDKVIPAAAPEGNRLPDSAREATLSEADDALSLFPCEDVEGPPGRCNDPATQSGHILARVPAAGVPQLHGMSATGSGTADDPRLRHQTDVDLEQAKRDAETLRVELGQLREAGEQLAQEYARLSQVCRQTDQRSAVATDVLNAIEHRLAPLEAVQALINDLDDKRASPPQLGNTPTDGAAGLQAPLQSIDDSLDSLVRDTESPAALHGLAIRPSENELPGGASEAVADLEPSAAELTIDLDLRMKPGEDDESGIAQVPVDAPRDPDMLSVDGSTRRRPETTTRRRRWAPLVGALAVCALCSAAVMWRSDPRVGLAARAILQAVRSATSRLPSRLLHAATLLTHVDGPRRSVIASRDTAVDTGSETPRISRAAGRGRAQPPGSAGFMTIPGTFASSRDTPQTARAGAQLRGMLGVGSVPSGAAVFINHRRVGETPLRFRPVPAGSHLIWIEHEGYERWSTSVLVPDGEQVRVSARLHRSR